MFSEESIHVYKRRVQGKKQTPVVMALCGVGPWNAVTQPNVALHQPDGLQLCLEGFLGASFQLHRHPDPEGASNYTEAYHVIHYGSLSCRVIQMLRCYRHLDPGEVLVLYCKR